MKVTSALRTNPFNHSGRSKKVRRPKKHTVNIVWILMWVFFLIGLMLAIGIFYAAIHVDAGSFGSV